MALTISKKSPISARASGVVRLAAISALSVSLGACASPFFGGLPDATQQAGVPQRISVAGLSASDAERLPAVLASDAADDHGAAFLLDGDDETYWRTNDRPSYPVWLSFRYREAWPIGEVVVTTRAGEPDEAPSEYHVEALVDGLWVELLHVTNACGSQPEQHWPLDDPVESDTIIVTAMGSCGAGRTSLQSVTFDRQ